MNDILTENDIERFTLDIKNGCFMWKLILKNDDTIYQILYTIESHKTPKGNISKRKVYFIDKIDKVAIFDNDVKKQFIAFKRPYIISGI